MHIREEFSFLNILHKKLKIDFRLQLALLLLLPGRTFLNFKIQMNHIQFADRLILRLINDERAGQVCTFRGEDPADFLAPVCLSVCPFVYVEHQFFAGSFFFLYLPSFLLLSLTECSVKFNEV